MPKNNGVWTDLMIRPPRKDEWGEIGALLAKSIPHALVSSLGRKSGALYYEHMAKHSLFCSYGAFDKNDQLAGIILGTLNHKVTELLNFSLFFRLLLAANFRLFSPVVFRWVVRGRPHNKAQKILIRKSPQAELKIIAVNEQFKGNGIAGRLIDELEAFFRENNLEQSYLIRTEKSNRAANYLYEKIGAEFKGTYAYHDKLINVWHKSL